MNVQTQEQIDARESALNDATRLIKWLKDNPEIPVPSEFSGTLHIFEWNSKDEAAQMAKAMGTCEKSYDDSLFRLVKSFGSLKLEGVFTRQSVCERVVVGSKEIESEEADPVAVAALPRVKVKKTVEIVEWRCPETLLGASATA